MVTEKSNEDKIKDGSKEMQEGIEGKVNENKENMKNKTNKWKNQAGQ